MFQTRPIFLFTDFSLLGPYVGQMHARLLDQAGALRIIDLMHDAPAMRPDLAAYLLPPVCRLLPEGAIIVAVVDPGVGGSRRPLVVETSHLTFVGPDNGLLSRLPGIERVSVIDWRPDELSMTFHGRDLFAPVAARLAVGRAVPMSEMPADRIVGADWPRHLAAVIYIDGFGNAVTGIESEISAQIQSLTIKDELVPRAATFGDVSPGEPFWYVNSLGLVEIAVNQGSAAACFALALGDKILVTS